MTCNIIDKIKNENGIHDFLFNYYYDNYSFLCVHGKASHLVALYSVMTKSYVHYYFILMDQNISQLQQIPWYEFIFEGNLTTNKTIINWYSSLHLITMIYCSYLIVTAALRIWGNLVSHFQLMKVVPFSFHGVRRGNPFIVSYRAHTFPFRFSSFHSSDSLYLIIWGAQLPKTSHCWCNTFSFSFFICFVQGRFQSLFQ